MSQYEKLHTTHSWASYLVGILQYDDLGQVVVIDIMCLVTALKQF